ncbi:MAG: hypothetical protein AAF517_09740, partial [Planctomycetota bacterium]
KDESGRPLANASIGLPGVPKGPFHFDGTRDDDPNDTVLHENRRELRGFRLFMAWLNNTDVRRGNTLDMYVEEDGRRFLKHYVIDFSGSLGSENIAPKDIYEGHEYFIDPGTISLSLSAFGIWVKPWEIKDPKVFESVGRIDFETFDPESWKTIYANPAFEKMTDRDAFWATKIITSFTDEDLSAIIDTGYFPEKEAKEHLLRVLIERRNTIGRTWFDEQRVNPLDRFRIERDGGADVLRFEDFAVSRGFAEASGTQYSYCIDGGGKAYTSQPEIRLARTSGESRVVIQTKREGKRWGAELVLTIEAKDGVPSVVRVSR